MKIHHPEVAGQSAGMAGFVGVRAGRGRLSVVSIVWRSAVSGSRGGVLFLRSVVLTDSVMLGRIAVRRAELDLLEEELVKRLADVRVERDELVVAERVVQQISEQGF
jgi:hypothetical protein